MDLTLAKCPVNLYRISATDLGNSQSHKTYIFTCNLIKTLMAKICSHSWTMISFMLVIVLIAEQSFHWHQCKTLTLRDAHGTWGFWWLWEEEGDMCICTIMMTPLEVHIYTNPSFPFSWNEILCQFFFFVLGFFFPCTGYVKSMYNEKGVLHPILAHAWWTGYSETCSDIHVTESVPYGLMLKTLFISLCLPFPSCSMSVIIQTIFKEKF